MNINVIGAGYVGLVTASCFAHSGHKVKCYDIDQHKIELLKKGKTNIYEPQLESLLKENLENNRLSFSDNLQEVSIFSNIFFICVGTPPRGSGEANLLALYKSVFSISENTKNAFLIIKSTVPPGTCEELSAMIDSSKNISISMCPEFLREGEAIRDFIYPDRVVVGSNDSKSQKILKSLYSPLISKGAKFVSTKRRAAELIKYASNAFLATKITFINEIANLCEKTGIDIEDISIGIGLDKRIGSRFLRAGPAYGGSCFPKDTKALVSTADKFKTNLSVVKSVIRSNDLRSDLLSKRVSLILNNKIKNKVVSILGVTFKANTDDMRDSSSLKLIPFLSKKGAKIKYYDPTGSKKEFKKLKNVEFSNSIQESIKGSDITIIHTEWNDFKSINFKKLVKGKKFIIFDMRNIYSSTKIKDQGFKYFSVGQ